MNATPAGLDTVKNTFGRVVTTLSGEPTRSGAAHIVLDGVSSRVSFDPLTTTSESTIVFEPVAIDSSVRVQLGELPPTEVRSPYEQTWSWSVLGRELFSLTIRGHVTTHVTPGVPDRAQYRVVDVGTSDVSIALPAGIPSGEYAGQQAVAGPPERTDRSGSGSTAASDGPSAVRRSRRASAGRR